jgi:apurinic endonuclease APN1
MIVHCGSRQDATKGIEMVSKAVNFAILNYGITIFIENSAGQGKSLGKNIDEIFRIYDQIENKKNVSLCLDTAHLFASGYDVRNPEKWNDLVMEIEERFGSNKVGLFHFNDSKADLGSRVDRHWHIGKGSIGADAFKIILNDKRFKNGMGVMETPKIDNMDEENMKVMRSLLSPLVPGPSS